MKNIGIFSPQLNKNHIVFYESLSYLINRESINKVYYFLDNWFSNKIKFNENDNFIINKSKYEFLNYIYNLKKLKKMDLLIVDPFFSKPLFVCFILFFNCKYSLVIHNANYWLNPTKPKSFKELIKILLNKIIINKSFSLIVVNTRVKNYAQKFTNKKIYSIPFNLSLEKESLKSNNIDKVYIVVPGNVSSSRRDYFILFKAFELLMQNTNYYNLVLLGKIDKSNNKLSDELNNLKRKYSNNILTWTNFINDDEFIYYARRATFFIAPLIRYFQTDLSIEEYGTTKETGVTSFIRKYNRLCFAPDYIRFESDIKNLIIPYSSHIDLFSKIKSLNSIKVDHNNNVCNTDEYLVTSLKEIKDFLHQIDI